MCLRRGSPPHLDPEQHHGCVGQKKRTRHEFQRLATEELASDRHHRVSAARYVEALRTSARILISLSTIHVCPRPPSPFIHSAQNPAAVAAEVNHPVWCHRWSGRQRLTCVQEVACCMSRCCVRGRMGVRCPGPPALSLTRLG